MCMPELLWVCSLVEDIHYYEFENLKQVKTKYNAEVSRDRFLCKCLRLMQKNSAVTLFGAVFIDGYF